MPDRRDPTIRASLDARIILSSLLFSFPVEACRQAVQQENPRSLRWRTAARRGKIPLRTNCEVSHDVTLKRDLAYADHGGVGLPILATNAEGVAGQNAGVQGGFLLQLRLPDRLPWLPLWPSLEIRLPRGCPRGQRCLIHVRHCVFPCRRFVWYAEKRLQCFRIGVARPMLRRLTLRGD